VLPPAASRRRSDALLHDSGLHAARWADQPGPPRREARRSTTRSTTRRARRTTRRRRHGRLRPSATKTSEQSPRFYATNASGPVMDARQESASNPFWDGRKCENCPELCEARTTIAHGYGDVGAGSSSSASHPARAADRTGIPFVGDDERAVLCDVLAAVDMCGTPTRPSQNSRTPFSPTQRGCRHPEREPTDREVRTASRTSTAGSG